MVKKKPGRRPQSGTPKNRNMNRHVKPRESFHLEPELQAALTDCAERSDPPSDKTAVIKAALREYLKRRGFYPRPPQPATS